MRRRTIEGVARRRKRHPIPGAQHHTGRQRQRHRRTARFALIRRRTIALPIRAQLARRQPQADHLNRRTLAARCRIAAHIHRIIEHRIHHHRGTRGGARRRHRRIGNVARIRRDRDRTIGIAVFGWAERQLLTEAAPRSRQREAATVGVHPIARRPARRQRHMHRRQLIGRIPRGGRDQHLHRTVFVNRRPFIERHHIRTRIDPAPAHRHAEVRAAGVAVVRKLGLPIARRRTVGVGHTDTAADRIPNVGRVKARRQLHRQTLQPRFHLRRRTIEGVARRRKRHPIPGAQHHTGRQRQRHRRTARFALIRRRTIALPIRAQLARRQPQADHLNRRTLAARCRIAAHIHRIIEHRIHHHRGTRGGARRRHRRIGNVARIRRDRDRTIGIAVFGWAERQLLTEAAPRSRQREAATVGVHPIARRPARRQRHMHRRQLIGRIPRGGRDQHLHRTVFVNRRPFIERHHIRTRIDPAPAHRHF